MSTSERIDRLRSGLGESGLDAFIAAPSPTLRYLTGADFHLSERLLLLVVPVEGELVAVLPNLEQQKWEDDVAALDSRLFTWDDAEGPDRALAEAAAVLGPLGRVGVDSLALRYMEYVKLRAHLPETEIRAADDLVERLRICKSEDEIEALRRAVAIAEEALVELLTGIQVGTTEREIAGRLSSLLLEKGGEGIPFGPIVLSGPKSALPHGVPDERRLGAGELLLLDFGTTYRGYASDITRTFFVSGEPDEQTRRVYAAVEAANARGRAAVRPGATAHEVHHQAQNALEAPEWSDYFRHRTGHGLGLDIHEPPSVMAGNREVLEPGTVFTVEPGLYLKGWGGVRIEDDMVVTADGGESLTTHPRELRVLPG